MTDAVGHYHDLLATGRAAADAQEVMDRLQTARGLAFGERPLCTALRPRFLSPDQYRAVRRKSEALLPAFRATYDRALADASFREQFRLTDAEEELLTIDPGFDDPSPSSRLDSFFDGQDRLQFTEYNTETPAGAGYSDALIDVFHALPVFQEFQRRYHVTPNPCQPGVLHAMLSTYRDWQRATGNREPLRVAILDWREVPTFSEFVLIYDYLRAAGIESRIADPRDCELINGKLMCGDFHATFVYKRVIITELIERGGIDHPLILAVRAGAACVANTFRGKILFKKASFAVLGDERNTALYTPEQRQLIRAHIPWTRLVEERKTVVDGETIDLVPYTLANRHKLVLKPNDDYGGKGIVLGWTLDTPAWEAAVHAALAAPTVVQEKIVLPREPYPSCDGAGNLHVSDRMVDTNPYVSRGVVTGCLTRISSDEMVNVTAGSGSTLTTFLIESR